MIEYAELVEHIGHRIEIVEYAHGENVALECVTCYTVLEDCDRP